MAFQQVSPAVAAAVVILAAVSRAQAVSTLNGTWRGTSICTTVGKPACHDEVVVYYTRLRDSSKPAPIPLRLDWTANKIVGGKEESMGELVCGVQPDRRSVICPMRDWRWRFAVRGDTMTGTLVNANEVVWRTFGQCVINDEGRKRLTAVVTGGRDHPAAEFVRDNSA